MTTTTIATKLDPALPHNLDAEKAVLGAILMDQTQTALNTAATAVRPDDFYRDAHQVLFRAMLTLSDQGKAIDTLTIREALGPAGLDRVGGLAYIASLVDGVPSRLNVDHYAAIVKEKANRRRVFQVTNEVAHAALAPGEETTTILDRAQQALFALSEGTIRSDFEPIRDVLRRDDFADRRAIAARGVPTGFVDLDTLTAGLQPADLVILAARPSMGKTALALNMARNVAGTRRVVGVTSLEMSREQLVARLVTAEARIDAQRFRKGTLRDSEWAPLADGMARLYDLPIFIDDAPTQTVTEIRAKARRLAAKEGLDLLVIDYLQLIAGSGRSDNRTQELGQISRSLKGLARELGVPIVALSQLSRAPEARSDHRPQLSDLRESGALEQDADVVFLLYRAAQYDPTPENEGEAEVIIAKQRNGPTETVKLAFLKEFTRFDNYDWRNAQ